MTDETREAASARTIIVRLTPSTHKALRIRVAEEDTSIQRWVEALIEEALGIGGDKQSQDDGMAEGKSGE